MRHYEQEAYKPMSKAHAFISITGCATGFDELMWIEPREKGCRATEAI